MVSLNHSHSQRRIMLRGCCPGMGTLKRFVMGDLSDSEMTTLAVHLDQCDSCLRTVENGFQERFIANALNAVPGKHPGSDHGVQDAEAAVRLGPFDPGATLA